MDKTTERFCCWCGEVHEEGKCKDLDEFFETEMKDYMENHNPLKND